MFRKQAWIWSLGDAYRIKDRPRFMSSFGMNSTMDTLGHNPLRYSIGDNNNNNYNEVCYLLNSISNIISFSCIQEENEGEITQGDRLNEIKARRMQHHHTSSSPSWIPPNTNVTSSFT